MGLKQNDAFTFSAKIQDAKTEGRMEASILLPSRVKSFPIFYNRMHCSQLNNALIAMV